MSRRILDSDSSAIPGDSLAKEWSLPELPEESSSHPGSSKELAEIFGTSDDEDDDIPFNFNIGKSPFTDIELPSEGDKSFESSLLSVTGQDESGLLFESLQESLGINQFSSPKGLLIPSSDLLQSEGDSADSDGPAAKSVTNLNRGTDRLNEMKDGSSSEDSAAHSRLLRKSTRLRGRRSEREPATLHKQMKFPKSDSGAGQSGTEPSSSAPKKDTDGVENLAETTAEKSTEPESERQEGGEKAEQQSEEGGEEEEEEGEGGESDEDSESDEDPGRLWCICKQPHDDRFMICCDLCEEWFHGDCVGITIGQGKRMEREGKDYVCPVCLDKERREKEERDLNRSARQARREQEREVEIKKIIDLAQSSSSPSHTPPHHSPAKLAPVKSPKATKPLRKRISSSSSTGHAPSAGHTPSTSDGDQYGLSQLFLPDNASSRTPTAEDSTTEEEPSIATTPCIGPGCDKPAYPPSIYCSTTCVESYAKSALKRLAHRGVTIHKNPAEFVRGAGGLPVVEKATGKTLVGIAAPSEKNLVSWLKVHPSYQVLMVKRSHSKVSSRSHKSRAEGKKEREESDSSRIKMPSLLNPESVRTNAKKALAQILTRRLEGADDLTITPDDVQQTADSIEEQLFSLHHDINPRYKNKYRSLVFNLKDTKNQGLFRKVLLKELPPKELVRMSSDRLASEELAQWRMQTIKKDLELIKVREEEEAHVVSTIRKKTYKGDVEIESSDVIVAETIETVPAESAAVVAPVATPTTPTAATPLGSLTTQSHSQSKDTKSQSQSKDTKSQSQSSDSKSQVHFSDSKSQVHSDGVLELLTDTTAQHGNHVFDQHCDICMGKVGPSSEAKIESSSDPESNAYSAEMLWQGIVHMPGITTFGSEMYPVSGPSEFLKEVLPPTLQVMGRIAHVQVWDYIDKLKSSSRRDIVILRFEPQSSDKDAYMAMFDYLVHKHRCAVINGNCRGVKDFYLVPVLQNEEVVPQLLPFDGPGLPRYHPDLLIGVVVRSKIREALAHKSPPQKFQTTFTLGGSQKRSHSTSEIEQDEIPPEVKRSRQQYGDQTPPEKMDLDHRNETKTDVELSPHIGSHDDASTNVIESEGVAESTSEENMEVEVNAEEDSSKAVSAPVSFYGEHQPLSEVHPALPSSSSSLTVGSSVVSTPVGDAQSALEHAAAALPSSANFQSILSQLSKEKMQELASAVSTLSQVNPTTSSSSSSSSSVPTSSMTQATSSTITDQRQPETKAAESLAAFTPISSVPLQGSQSHWEPGSPRQQQQQPQHPPQSQQPPQPVLSVETHSNPPPPPPALTQDPSLFNNHPPPPPPSFPATRPPPTFPPTQPSGWSGGRGEGGGGGGGRGGHQQPPAFHGQGGPPPLGGYPPSQQQPPYNQSYPQSHPPPPPPHSHPHPPQEGFQQQQQHSSYPPPPHHPHPHPPPHEQRPQNSYYGGDREFGPGQEGRDYGYNHPPPQGTWEQQHRGGVGGGGGGGYYGNERYGDQYDTVSKLDRIKSKDYDHKSVPHPPPSDWRRRDRDRGGGGREGFRGRPRR